MGSWVSEYCTLLPPNTLPPRFWAMKVRSRRRLATISRMAAASTTTGASSHWGAYSATGTASAAQHTSSSNRMAPVSRRSLFFMGFPRLPGREKRAPPSPAAGPAADRGL